jgi:aspartate aminotransferase
MSAVEPHRLSERIGRIRMSPSLEAGDAARELAAKGVDVISMAGGQPDFDTPDPIKQAAAEAMARGETKYTPIAGSVRLRKAIVAAHRRDTGQEAAMNEVVVGNGGKQVIFNAFFATLDAGDEVLIPAPYWVSYPDAVLANGGTPVFLPCNETQGFKLHPAQLAAAITAKTRWLVINSPSNPSGAVYTQSELRALAEVLLQHPHVMVLSDDIYQHIAFAGGPAPTMLAVEPRLAPRVLTVNGVSKAYSMTGWRIGWGIGPGWLASAIAVAQSQTTSCASSISQAAAAAALEGPADHLRGWNEAFRQRRDLAVRMLNETPGLACPVPDGAFYVYPSCAGVIGKRANGTLISSDGDFCRHLLHSAGVAVVAGSAFGLSPCFRISYALGIERLQEACQRIQCACAELRE